MPVLRSITAVWIATLLRVAMMVTIGSAIGGLSEGRGPSGWQALCLVLLPVAVAALEFRENSSYGPRQARLEKELRREVVTTAWAEGPAQSGQRRSGQVVSLATDSVERAAAMKASFTGPMIGQMTAPIIVLIAVGFTVGVRQALILAIVLPLVPVMVRGFQKAFASVSGRHREASAGLASQFLEALQGLTDLRLLGAGARFGVKLATKSEELRRRVMTMLAANQVVILVADAGFSLGMLVVAVWLALSGLASGALTLGPAITLVLLAPLLMEPLSHIGKFFYVGMGGRAASKALKIYVSSGSQSSVKNDDVRDVKAGSGDQGSRLSPKENDGGTAPGPGESPAVGASVEENGGPALAIELRDVDFGWTPGHRVLVEANLTVQQGEHVALVGPSGGGKSTVLALIEGLASPDGGEILLGGRALSTAERREMCAIVRQSAFLFTGTLKENLLLAKPDATDEELVQALEAANLSEIWKWPHGLATQLGERGLEISGGQAQRIAIARAFLRNAPILLLDEPTSQVDLASERAIRDALARLREGRTVVTVAHRRALVDAADRVLEVREGEVIA
ncbi:MAG: ATP-binding cassette domain-containing protein [Ancrocorticia sp.]